MQDSIKMLLKVVCFIVAFNGAFGADTRNIWQYLNDNSQYSTLVGLIKDANLESVLQASGAMTILAPTNAAFTAMPQNVLSDFKRDHAKLSTLIQFHIFNQTLITPFIGDGAVVSSLTGQKVTFHKNGSNVYANGALLSSTDTIESNGVVHTINSVLVPATENIVQYLVKHDKQFSDLFAAIVVTHLESALEHGDFTLFAPTDAAFSKITNGLPGDATALEAILKNHVVPGVYPSDLLKDGQTLHTLGGKDLTISLTNGLHVGTAAVTTPDVMTTNGVIHIIDTVQLPS